MDLVNIFILYFLSKIFLIKDCHNLVFDYDKQDEDFIVRWEEHIAGEFRDKEVQEQKEDMKSKLDRNSRK